MAGSWKRRSATLVATAVLLTVPVTLLAQHGGHGHHHGGQSPYAGEHLREVKALSARDIAALRQGAGWGFARPAELNGVPGPKHLLELKDQLALSPGQVEALEGLFEDVKREAVPAGEAYIAAETELDKAFQMGVPDDKALEALVRAAAKARSHLRLIHLRRHVEAYALLTPTQLSKYSELRGYK